MLSGRGYCTQPTCFPLLGSPPILVFLCKNHCGHMLCYKHWLLHQTDSVDEQKHLSSIATLDSDVDEQNHVPDLLNECTNQMDIDSDQTKDTIKPVLIKVVEWWNEIIPWKNNENFYRLIANESNDDESDTNENLLKTDETKRKRRSYKKRQNQSIACRNYVGECPLTFDGAFGLVQSYHQHQLCSPTKNSQKKICLYQHFNSKHGFTREISSRLVRAIIDQEDPFKTRLFSKIHDTPSTLYDPYHKVRCPLTDRTDLINTPCLVQEITRKSIRRHLLGVHRLNSETADRLIKEMIR